MTGEEERGVYTTTEAEGHRALDALLAANERIVALEEQLRLAEAQYASAMRINEQRREENEQRREENEHLRRLLVAVLPPDAVYQEARELATRLRDAR